MKEEGKERIPNNYPINFLILSKANLGCQFDWPISLEVILNHKITDVKNIKINLSI